MKRSLLLFLFFIIISDLVISQDYWMQLTTPDSVTIIKTEISPDGNILLGTSKGIYYSLDEGLSWNKMGNLNVGVNNIEYFSDGEMCAGAGQLYNSIDLGQSWSLVNPNSWMQTLFRTSNNILLLGNWGLICKSVNRGIIWDTVYSPGSATVFESFIEKEGVVYSGGREYIGGENSGFYRSEDDGSTWNIISLQEYGITKLSLDNESNILAGVSISPAGQYSGLYKSTDNGVSWNSIYNQQPVVQVAVDSLGGYYIGLESSMGGQWGVYYSSDYGGSWHELNSGFNQEEAVYDLDINSNYIYCLCLNYKDERILYRSQSPIVSIPESEQTKSRLINLFPNPLRSMRNLNISNKSKEIYHLDIVNVNGAVILENMKIPGNSEKITSLNCDNWIPGLYILKFYNESRIVVKKVVKTNK